MIACGLVKNLALMVDITVGSAAYPTLEFLEEWGTENFEVYHTPAAALCTWQKARSLWILLLSFLFSLVSDFETVISDCTVSLLTGKHVLATIHNLTEALMLLSHFIGDVRQIKIAEWNLEKDLLAMVTDGSKILLNRFNWQRLWTISPAIAVGLGDGTIALHDNGKLLRSLKPHDVAVVCLNWEEDGQSNTDEIGKVSAYEDRTTRFFPPSPKIPGVVAGDSSFMDDGEDPLAELSNASFRKFNVLCSGDRDGSICFNIFGIFQIGKIVTIYVSWLLMVHHLPIGFHCLHMKNELHQVAQHASNIEDLTEVIRESLSVTTKQWADAMKTFHDKFQSLSTLITNNGLESSPQEEFLSLLGGARITPALKSGVKRVLKSVCDTGKELQMGELRGLSRWRARYQCVGLDERLLDEATEKYRSSTCTSATNNFSNFFNWLLKSIKYLMARTK
ncbi:hypothetical protein Bca52824_088803 [Brassica carinata]|uniref:Anaphase-promoting complex subunit 4 n=1 Tax=Brassica carinata TaxID=52824 RepID=A0A8X7PD63_BRACI|nr:hypothetical protein Bca52824_088803 [Brassica carinata]